MSEALPEPLTEITDQVVKHIKNDIANCRLKGLLVEPFVAAPAMEMTPIICRRTPDGREVPTAAVSGRRLYVNPDFWNSLIKTQRIGLFMHEVWHIALGHHLRRGHRNPKLWNIACDYHINIIITEAGFDLPEGGLLDMKYVGWSEERIYQELYDNALVIQMPSNATQQLDPNQDQGQGGGAGSTVIVEHEGNSNGQSSEGGSEPSDSLDASSGQGDQEKEDHSGDSASTTGASSADDIDRESGTRVDEDSSSEAGEDGESDTADESDGSEDGSESDGSDCSGDNERDGGVSERQPEPDAPPDEATITVKHEDAYKDVPWGEVWDAEDEDGKELDAQAKREEMTKLKEDLQMAKSMNHQSAGDSGRVNAIRSVTNLVHPNTDWSAQVRMFFNRNGNPSGRSWHALDRRGMQRGVYEPAIIKESIDWMVCFWDISSSMDWPSHRALLSQLNAVRKQIEIKRMTIVPFNSWIQNEDIIEIKKGDKLPQSFKIGGGTRFDAPFNWLKAQPGEPDGVIVFTDLGSTVTVPKPKAPVLWVSSEPVVDPGQHHYRPTYSNRPPWGRVVEIKLN